ncbi:hypothetical protein B5F40_08755 [Gordonibacter sp. An230]|uniref:hypothetical protein n=1 Tax=Gordonibacter sp. An230 TaxID=1965592 RepID=UPI000B388C1A|nr:hypothetical protein [Gordonibacter sp. An230]OUO89915.1 hypothetical protein B5F40_08755 [Gordonibacter sp. An230]
MGKTIEWIKGHKPHAAAISIAAVAIVAVAVAAASGAFSTAQPEPSDEATAKTADLVLDVTADKGWDADSTPAIAHITGEGVDIYHAVSPDAEGNKGTSTVTVGEGDYTVDFISPVNADGSAYELFDTGDAQDVTVDADAKDAPTVTCEMTQIPAEKVTDEMLKAIVADTEKAVDKGDETLKGDAGKGILDKLSANVGENPNASDETKKDADDADRNADLDGEPGDPTAPAGNADSSNDAGNAASTDSGGSSSPSSNGGGGGGSSSQPSKPSHTHSWKDHTATKQTWVPNIVTVIDYDYKKVAVGTKYIFTEDGYTTTDPADAKAHGVELVKNGGTGSHYFETIYETQKVQVGSHEEDHGSYKTESYVDYQYCDCGATR